MRWNEMWDEIWDEMSWDEINVNEEGAIELICLYENLYEIKV